MGWSDEVHSSRVDASLQRARRVRCLRLAGQPITKEDTASPLPFLATVAAVSGVIMWAPLHRVLLRQVKRCIDLPGMKHIHRFLAATTPRQTSRTLGASGRAASTSKASTSKPTPVRGGRGAATPTPAGAAGAAAARRAAQPASTSAAAPAARAFDEFANSSTSGSGKQQQQQQQGHSKPQGGNNKKKGKKKR